LRGVLLKELGKLDLFSIDLVHTSGRGSFLEDPIVLNPARKSVILYSFSYLGKYTFRRQSQSDDCRAAPSHLLTLISLAVEPNPGFFTDLFCFQPIGLSETPLYIEKLFEEADSVLSGQLPGDERGEVEGGRAIVKAIFSDIFILDNNADVRIYYCAFASQLQML
jgi:hypothetical protein